MSRREFLMLAHPWRGGAVLGMLASEKLDGQRAFWDGGVSRGVPADEVPWANTAKDARYVMRPVATGLWSRYGKVVHAPGWWLDELPLGVPLDLELWMGRGRHQELRSCVSTLVPGPGWAEVRAMALDAPALGAVLAPGEVRNPNWTGRIGPEALRWATARGASAGEEVPFRVSHRRVRATDVVVVPLEQVRVTTRSEVEEMLERVVSGGGEGLVLRDPESLWVPQRSRSVLKVKPADDAEGTVVGHTWGRETDKGSRHLGRMGALVLRLAPGVPHGAPMTERRLELSGFTDAEREVVMLSPGAEDEPARLEGRDATDAWGVAAFPRGTVVTFRYRELSDAGVPKEARYWRRREPGT